jgi:F-type H+-transporting ATPase subunit gamma
MSRASEIRQHLHVLGDIGGILGAMKNLAFLETRKLTRYLANQGRVVTTLQAALQDFLGYHPELVQPLRLTAPGVLVLIGAERGFCGDFNERLVEAFEQHWAQTSTPPRRVLVVGRRLAVRLAADPRIQAAIAGPTVAEEIEMVLNQLMDTLRRVDTALEDTRPFSLAVLSHQAEDHRIVLQTIPPLPEPLPTGRRFSHPPLLHLEARHFFAELLDHYLFALLHALFYSSLMAENHRRIQHMEQATQRIQRETDALNLSYNVLRQEAITEEIEVILLSADALRRDYPGDVLTYSIF